MKFRFFILFIFILSSLFAQKEEEIKTPEQLLSKLIQFKSYSGREFDIAHYLERFCKSKGLYIQEFKFNDTLINFTASLYPLEQKKPNVIFTSHLDVVPARDENWSFKPFAGTIERDTVFGRGSIDCLGLAVMQIFSLIENIDAARKTDFSHNFTFLAVIGEENNSHFGAKYIVDNFLSTLNPVAVFGEGGSGLTDLVPSKPNLAIFGISTAEKSSIWLRLEVNKKTNGHGAVPPDLYANKRLLKSLIYLLEVKREIQFSKLSRKMFRELGKQEGGVKGFVIKHINWAIFWPFVKKYFRDGEIFSVLVSNTFVITDMGTINSRASNQIGSGAYAILDCRLLPGTDIKKFLRKVQFAVGAKVDVKVISDSPNSPPSEITPYFFEMQKALKVIYPESKSTQILFPASTDNNFFRLAKIPAYGLIPCVLSRESLEGVHGENEYIPVRDLHLGKDVYKELIRGTSFSIK